MRDPHFRDRNSDILSEFRNREGIERVSTSTTNKHKTSAEMFYHWDVKCIISIYPDKKVVFYKKMFTFIILFYQVPTVREIIENLKSKDSSTLGVLYSWLLAKVFFSFASYRLLIWIEHFLHCISPFFLKAHHFLLPHRLLVNLTSYLVLNFVWHLRKQEITELRSY